VPQRARSGEIEKIKKKKDELEAAIKKHFAEATHSDKKRLDDLDSRIKALEERVKKKL
jgi:hypothetical protein